jgi:death on curing protein
VTDNIVWIEEREALAIHQRLLVLYGGAVGVRQQGAPAIGIGEARQAAPYAGERTIPDLAAL